MSMKNPLTPAGIESATFRFVAQHLNHCATADINFILHLNLEWRLRMGGATPPSSIGLTVWCIIEG